MRIRSSIKVITELPIILKVAPDDCTPLSYNLSHKDSIIKDILYGLQGDSVGIESLEVRVYIAPVQLSYQQ